MDCRIDIAALLGIGETGDAHVLRNAGGVVTDDVVRSLAVSQRLLGTTAIALIHHTDCGMEKVEEDGFLSRVEAECGVRPPWAVGAFTDPYADVIASIDRIRSSPFIPHRDDVRGYVYDVASDTLREVS
jgi:carbonic anhydrase